MSTQNYRSLISKIYGSPFSYPEPFLRAVRRGALAKSITGYRKNMVRKQYPVLELANQVPVRIWIWPEPLVAPRVRRALGTRMMAAMAWPRARPNVLHPRQYGGINLERAYWYLHHF
jgi:hypothetical protein